ncbi:MAG: DUF4250 domain-containing protein [Lachnospiraceae bacterium]|nr:DUF4250 domain-containing protein [Lachnospiraceae bacterium]
MIPKDPNMLVSYVNLGLRDKYEDFEDMAANEGFDADEIKDKLMAAGYEYNGQAFVSSDK